ncbi:hypothetical protein [Gelidibacter japonicus]|uniref:hypothetical protein n=1 Tax=Gelidibacter japonicus TaxID=1962232 RepID=UPI002AFECD9C|nr:hypothetical protein [Gelidibacter japonicus]
MSTVIVNRDLKHNIEATLRNSQQYLFIISPYIDISIGMQKALSEVSNNTIITVVYRKFGGSSHKSGINDASRLFLRSLPNIEFVVVEDLHAKIYLNEDTAIISTMNLTQSSHHNFEIGVGIDRFVDTEMYTDTLEYIIYMLQSDKSDLTEERFENIKPTLCFTLDIYGKEIKINGKVISKQDFENLQAACNVKHGYCIRCKTPELEFNPLSPYCKKCFNVWLMYKNRDYEENCCHRCGRDGGSSIASTLCDSCDEIYTSEIERAWLGQVNVKFN